MQTVEPTTGANIAEGFNTVQVCLFVLLTSFSVIGAMGNSLVLFVYARKKDRQVSTYFILFMSVVDLITCSVVIPLTIYFEYVGHAIGDYDLLCKLYQFSLTSVVPLSALTMAAIAVDRYLSICHPFVRLLDVRRARIVSILLVVLASSLGAIAALIHGVEPAVDNCPSMGESYEAASVSSTWYTTEPTTASLTSLQPITDNSNLTTAWKVCRPNFILIGCTVAMIYHKIYNAVYLYCLVHVLVLYSLVLRSIVARRLARSQAKSKTVLLVAQQKQLDVNKTLPTCQKSDSAEITYVAPIDASSSAPHPLLATNGKSAPASVKADSIVTGAEGTVKLGNSHHQHHHHYHLHVKSVMSSDLMANIRMAAMLFVVAFVFIVAFLPACLMSMQVMTENVIVFYLYFAYNVANPIIYSFMNKNFRDDLRKLFC